MRRSLPLLLCTVVLAACENRPLPTDPLPLQTGAVISHAPTGGNAGFFWLPPLAQPGSAPGDVNMKLSPTIRVCPAPAGLPADPSLCTPEQAIEEFTGAAISKESDHYHVNWDTKASPALVTGQYYRVFALVTGTVVGFIDVYIGATGKDAKSAAGDEVFGLVDGRTLPLKFRLERGVLTENGAGCAIDCAEFTATNEAFEECSAAFGVCLSATEGWLPEGFEEVSIVIDRIRPTSKKQDKCFPLIGLPQGEGCYTVTTHPKLSTEDEFNSPVFWFMCQDDELPGYYEIHQQTENGDVRRPLHNPGTSQLSCESFGMGDSGLTDWLHRLARPVQRFLFGAPAYAADFFSAQIRSFSKFFYAASVTVQEFGEPQDQDGSTLLSFRVLSDHHHEGETPTGVAGVRVEFTADGGELSAASAVSNADGVVTVLWTPPAVDGEQTFSITASIPVLVAALEDERPSATTLVTVGDDDGGELNIVTLATGLHYPKGMWLSTDGIYITETGNRNTTFDNHDRVNRYANGQLEPLLDSPVNSDAVVVTNAGDVLLGSYHGSLPGQVGAISRLVQTDDGWVELEALDVPIAIVDMFVDAEDTVYAIGASINPDATNLFGIPGPAHDVANPLAAGLLSAHAMTIHQSDIYYANNSGVHLLDDGGSTKIADRTSVWGLATDGIDLYYADVLTGTVGRLHWTGEAWEDQVLRSGLNSPLNVRFDFATGRLYFLEGGTQGGSYRDGTFGYMQVRDPIG